MGKYHRVVIKISGESLAGKAEKGIYDKEVLRKFAEVIVELHKNKVQIAVVVGAGNIWRGKLADEIGMDRAAADYMGMLGTVINALALQNMIEQYKVPTRVMTALPINAVAEPYIQRKAMHHLENNRVVIFGGGTGNPYFSTDTTAALRANEINAEVILMAKNGVDGVYDCDPRINPTAKLFKKVTYMDVLKNNIQVMDSTAITLCMENNIELRVFNINDPKNIIRIVNGEDIGTIIRKE